MTYTNLIKLANAMNQQSEGQAPAKSPSTIAPAAIGLAAGGASLMGGKNREIKSNLAKEQLGRLKQRAQYTLEDVMSERSDKLRRLDMAKKMHLSGTLSADELGYAKKEVKDNIAMMNDAVKHHVDRLRVGKRNLAKAEFARKAIPRVGAGLAVGGLALSALRRRKKRKQQQEGI